MHFIALAALNRIFGSCTADSLTEIKQDRDLVRLLLNYIK